MLKNLVGSVHLAFLHRHVFFGIVESFTLFVLLNLNHESVFILKKNVFSFSWRLCLVLSGLKDFCLGTNKVLCWGELLWANLYI